MIAAAAVLAVVLTTSTERDALMSRWTHAARTSVPSNRRLREGVAPPPSATAPLHELAVRELSVPGRYQLVERKEQRPNNPTWWQRFVAWVRDWLNALQRILFGRIHVSAKAAGTIADLIIAVLVLAVAAAAIRLLIAYRGRGRHTASVRALTPAADPASLYALAVERADRGEYAAAAQFLFRATLALLDVRGTVRDDVSATVGEIRRRLPDRDVVRPFDAVATAFVAGTYAERPLDAKQWERARDAYLALAREPAA